MEGPGSGSRAGRSWTDDQEIGGDDVFQPFHAGGEMGVARGGFAGDDQEIGADGLDEIGGGEAGGALDATGIDGDVGDVEFLDEGVQAGFLGGEGVGVLALDEFVPGSARNWAKTVKTRST